MMSIRPVCFSFPIRQTTMVPRETPLIRFGMQSQNGNVHPYATGILMPHSAYEHKLYVAQYGNPSGIPVLILHGGPGAGFYDNSLISKLDKNRFRIIGFDQRGAARSMPSASLEENTTQDLVQDIELLRKTLVPSHKLILTGGSWGSTLALAYAQTYPQHVGNMVLSGIFLGSNQELERMYSPSGVVAKAFPNLYAQFLELVPETHQKSMKHIFEAYHTQLNNPDCRISYLAAAYWCAYEQALMRAHPKDDAIFQFVNPSSQTAVLERQLAWARIENHYFLNQCFFNSSNRLTKPDNLKRIANIPLTLIHGTRDWITSFTSANLLNKALPQSSKLIPIKNQGHGSVEMENQIAESINAMTSIS